MLKRKHIFAEMTFIIVCHEWGEQSPSHVQSIGCWWRCHVKLLWRCREGIISLCLISYIIKYHTNSTGSWNVNLFCVPDTVAEGLYWSTKWIMTCRSNFNNKRAVNPALSYWFLKPRHDVQQQQLFSIWNVQYKPQPTFCNVNKIELATWQIAISPPLSIS